MPTIGTVTGADGFNGGTTKTFAHSNDGDYLLVGVATLLSTANPTGITYNGVSMSLVDEVAHASSVGIAVYGLASPAAGSNNVVVTWGNTGQSGVIAAVSVVDANSGTPLGTPANTTSAATAAPTVTVAGASGDLIIDFHAILMAAGTATTVTVDASQTSIHEGTLSSNTARRLCVSTEAGAASVSMDWSLSQSCRTKSVGVAIKAAGGGPTASRRDGMTKGLHRGLAA